MLRHAFVIDMTASNLAHRHHDLCNPESNLTVLKLQTTRSTPGHKPDI